MQDGADSRSYNTRGSEQAEIWFSLGCIAFLISLLILFIAGTYSVQLVNRSYSSVG